MWLLSDIPRKHVWPHTSSPVQGFLPCSLLAGQTGALGSHLSSPGPRHLHTPSSQQALFPSVPCHMCSRSARPPCMWTSFACHCPSWSGLLHTSETCLVSAGL